ncbi:hypothetical protein QYF36_002779 [Acer negundo]|nr:hypothetical protein QYF36_002779 [Acer negundo]
MAAGNFGFAGIVTEKLTEENYENWKECLKSYFIAQGLWDVVTGKEAKPEDEDETSPKYQEWMRKNAMALHAIQVSCRADTMSKLRGHESAMLDWKLLAEKRYLPVAEGECVVPVEVTSAITEYRTLYKAVEQGELETARDFIRNKPDAVRARITFKGDTALHVAVMAGQSNILKWLIYKMLPRDLELKNDMGYTAFSIAAINGFQEMADKMLNKNPDLVNVKDHHGLIPIVVASLYSSKEMVRYLYKKTPHEKLNPENPDRSGATLLNCLLTDEIYGISVEAEMQKVDTDQESSDEESITRSRQITWLRKVPDLNHLYHKKLRHAEAKIILKCIIKEIPKLRNSELERIGLNKAIYDAIKNGITEFVDEMIETAPEIIWEKDEKGRTIFAHAIVRRQENIFSHVYGLGAKMRIAVIRHDIFHNNFLHLAAKLSPPSRLDRISGAALQMQRELEWFEAPPMFVAHLSSTPSGGPWPLWNPLPPPLTMEVPA